MTVTKTKDEALATSVLPFPKQVGPEIQVSAAWPLLPTQPSHSPWDVPPLALMSVSQ